MPPRKQPAEPAKPADLADTVEFPPSAWDYLDQLPLWDEPPPDTEPPR